MVGTLPPIKGVSDYCIEQTRSLGKKLNILFFNFSSIYPEFLYPGGGTKEVDAVFRAVRMESVEIRNSLAWYNPLGWLLAGLGSEGKILHFHWWTFYLFPVFFTIAAVAKLRGKKIVCTIHNVTGHESGLLDRLFSGAIFSLPDAFIVHTKSNMAQLSEFFKVPQKKISVIPHGIYNFYRDREVPKKDARQKLGIPQGAKAILLFGNIRPYKGVEELLDAFLQARKKIPGLYLLVAGKAWDDSLRALIEGRLAGVEEKLLFFGYVPSSGVKDFFSAADLVVLPYKHFEAQSGPGNIALAFEKPLVVSDAGGLPELVDGKKFVFHAGDSGELAEKISLAFRPGNLAAMARASKKLRQEYSWEKIAEKTLGLYRGLE